MASSDGGGTYYSDYTDYTDVSSSQAHGFRERRVAQIESFKQNWRKNSAPVVDTRPIVQVTAITPGFDGLVMRKAGETFGIRSADGVTIPSWTVLAGTAGIDALIAAANPGVAATYRSWPGVKVRT